MILSSCEAFFGCVANGEKWTSLMIIEPLANSLLTYFLTSLVFVLVPVWFGETSVLSSLFPLFFQGHSFFSCIDDSSVSACVRFSVCYRDSLLFGRIFWAADWCQGSQACQLFELLELWLHESQFLALLFLFSVMFNLSQYLSFSSWRVCILSEFPSCNILSILAFNTESLKSSLASSPRQDQNNPIPPLLPLWRA